MVKFTDLNLQPEIQKALNELGFEYPTEIQAQAIPLLKDQKVNFHGQAQTGTGKTIAFGIPLIEQIEKGVNFPQALVVAPTRELAVQIADTLRSLATYTSISIVDLYGGVSLIQQEKALKKGADIIVGTPGRLLDHVHRGTLKLHRIATLVLDEADIMLDMGFKPDIDILLKYTSDKRNIWLFSATVKSGINEIKKIHMRDPIECRVTSKEVTTQHTKQYYLLVKQTDRLHALLRFINCTPHFYGIVFTPTKILAASIARALKEKGHDVDALHGDMSQAVRNQVIKKFKDKRCTILIATDVAARGIDVVGLTHVINYALPRDQENYVHRIGRTGRAGNEGNAITFVTQSEIRYLKRMAEKFKMTVEPLEIPTMTDSIDMRIDQALERFKQLSKIVSSVSPHVVSKMLPYLDTYTKDELIRHIMYLLLSSSDTVDTMNQKIVETSSDEGMQELMLNVGLLDGISKNDVLSFLIESKKIEKKDIKKVRVIRKRSFFKVPNECADHIALALHNKKLHGRTVQVRFVAS